MNTDFQSIDRAWVCLKDRRPACRAGRHLSHLVPEIYSATAHLVERIRSCQRACHRPAQMDPNRQLGIREGHKTVKGIKGREAVRVRV